MRRFVMAVLLVLIPFTVLEIGLRIAGIGGSIIYEENDAYGYRPRPSQQFSTMGFPVTILGNGFRGPVESSRLLFVGDSVTYGTAYVRDGETFPALMHGANAGVNGWGLPNVEQFLMHTDLSTYTQVVWTIPTCDTLRPFLSLRAGLISTNRRMIFRVEYMLRFLWYGMINKQPNFNDPVHFETNLESLQRAVAYLKGKGIPLLIVLLPYETEVTGGTVLETPYVARLKKLLDEKGIPHLAAKPEGDLKKIYRDGTHLTADGNVWLAGEISRELSRPAAGH